MPIISKSDLITHLYSENLEVITRGNDALIDAAIEDAQAEAKGYLSRFDLVALFGGEAIEPTIQDAYLKRIIKDITAWHLITLCNASVDLTLFRTRYQDAMEWLKMVQAGKVDPDGWTYKQDNPDTPFVEGARIQYSSNPKQNHHF